MSSVQTNELRRWARCLIPVLAVLACPNCAKEGSGPVPLAAGGTRSVDGRAGGASVDPSSAPEPTSFQVPASAAVTAPAPTPTGSPVRRGPVVPAMSLVSPSLGQRVGQNAVPVAGTVSGIRADDELWAVVYVNKVNRYYPQDGPLFLDRRTGKFDGRAFCNGVRGDLFKIEVYLAPQAANSEIAKMMAEWHRNSDYPGLNKLPDGAVELASVQVIHS